MKKHRHVWLMLGFLLLALWIPASAALAQDVIITPIPQAVTEIPDTEAEAVAGELVDLAEATGQEAIGFFDGLIDSLLTTPRSEIVRLLFIVGGVVLLLAGWRIYEYIILIAGFLVGAAIASALVITDSAVLNLIVLLIGGLIGALLSVFLYYIAVFFIGAYVGIALTGAIAAALTLTPVSPIALLIGGLIGGLIMLAVSVEFLILLAVIVGAQMLALGLGLGLLWVIIFAVIGLVVQFFLVRAFNYEIRRRPRPINPLRRRTV